MTKALWDIKHRPKTANEYITQNQEHRDLINKWISEKSIPHLLLSGHRGTGKTSLALLLADELGVDKFDFLKIDASKDNSVNVIRNKVYNFISGMPLNSEFKIVFLDEAEYLTDEAQHTLRGMMLDYADNARFILACNKPHKIIPELHSRCNEIIFTAPDRKAMTIRLVEILANENVKIKNLDIVEQYVDACYPDFRKLLITAQNGVRNGVLKEMTEIISDVTEFMVSIAGHLETDNWVAAREYLSKNVPDDKWEECYRFLYDYLHDIGKFKDVLKWKSGIIVIAEHLYRHAAVADSEINFAACLAKLSEI